MADTQLEIKPSDFPRTLAEALAGDWKLPPRGNDLLANTIIKHFPRELLTQGGPCGYRVVNGHAYPCYPEPTTGVCNQCVIPK